MWCYKNYQQQNIAVCSELLNQLITFGMFGSNRSRQNLCKPFIYENNGTSRICFSMRARRTKPWNFQCCQFVSFYFKSNYYLYQPIFSFEKWLQQVATWQIQEAAAEQQARSEYPANSRRRWLISRNCRKISFRFS